MQPQTEKEKEKETHLDPRNFPGLAWPLYGLAVLSIHVLFCLGTLLEVFIKFLSCFFLN